MRSLVDQIIQRLLQAPTPTRGSIALINIVLRWAAMADLNPALLYLRDSMSKATQIKSPLSIYVIPWEKLKQLSEPKQRKELVGWVMGVIIEDGFNSNIITQPSKNYFVENAIIDNNNVPDELGLAKQLTTLSPDEVESTMSKAAIGWALSLDVELIKADAISNRHYRHAYGDYKMNINYLFYMLYLGIADNLLQGEFTEEFLEKWRK